MLGAIIGDVVGPVYEVLEVLYLKENKKQRPLKERIKVLDKNTPLFLEDCSMTDDSVLTCAICDAYLTDKDYESKLMEYGKRELEKGLDNYGRSRFGKGFVKWLEDPSFNNSYGNGSSMRISSLPYLIDDLDELKKEIHASVIPTHNHKDAILSAEALGVSIWMAKKGFGKEFIKKFVEENYFKLDYDLEDLRKNYKFTSKAIDSVPQAIYVFLESNDFEDAIRKAISIGGDSDTIASMTGAIAESFYGIPDWMKKEVQKYIPQEYKKILDKEYEIKPFIKKKK